MTALFTILQIQISFTSPKVHIRSEQYYYFNIQTKKLIIKQKSEKDKTKFFSNPDKTDDTKPQLFYKSKA